MKVHTDFKTLQPLNYPVVTIGTFDGVHKGHIQIINRVIELAKKNGGESILLTFYPHPRMILHPEDHNLKLLNTPEEKIELLSQVGIDHLIVYPFSAAFARLTAYDYIRDLIVNGIKAKVVVSGYDHRFGRNREGNHTTLIELADLFGFGVEEIPAQAIDEVNISSTKIRESLRIGSLEEATRYLGRPYTLSGSVVHGDKVGAKLGFPTANIEIEFPFKLVPGFGVYLVKVHLDNKILNGVLNHGIRPTVHSEGKEIIEVHIVNFNNQIYGKQITVEFVKKLRDEKKFGSIDELKLNITNDLINAVNYFA